MIRGDRSMDCSSDAEAARAILSDILDLDLADVGEGWLTFDALEGTDHTLKARGVDFIRSITDAGFGVATRFRMPGNVIADLCC